MNLLFHLSEAIKGLAKARLATILSITSITLVIILLALFTILVMNVNSWIGSFREKIELEVFIDSSAKEEHISQISEEFESIPGIYKTEFINKENAAERFKSEFGQDIYDVLTFNPLPESFIITLDDSARNLKSVNRITKRIESLPFIEEIVYQKLLLESIDKYITYIFLGAFFVGLIIILITSALIYNTIRLTIYARRDTIYIMRLVGATQAFIRTPFIIEGILQGFISSVFASVILYYLVKFIRFAVYPFLIFDNYIFIFLIVFGVFLGLISAGMGVTKFLKSV